jgi:hypothetical protein
VTPTVAAPGAARSCVAAMVSRLELAELPATFSDARPALSEAATSTAAQRGSGAVAACSSAKASGSGSNDRTWPSNPQRRSSEAYWPVLAPTSRTDRTPAASISVCRRRSTGR